MRELYLTQQKPTAAGVVREVLGRCSTGELRAWITARDRPGPLLVRRDPRDLSRVFVLDPDDHSYLEVPTRNLSRPAISLWEHRLARRRLRLQHRDEVDDAPLFAAVEEMRAIERNAARLTRSARRDRVRRSLAPEQPGDPPPAAPVSMVLTNVLALVPDTAEAIAPSPFDTISPSILGRSACPSDSDLRRSIEQRS